MVEALRVEHQPVHGCGGTGDRLPDAGLDVVDVGEEQPVVEAVDQHPGRELRGRMQADVGIPTEPFDPAEHRVMRLGTSSDGVDDRQRDRQQQGLEDTEDDDADHRGGGEPYLDLADSGQSSPGTRVDQSERGGDDDRPQHSLGQILHGRGEEQQHHGDDPGGHQSGELCATADLVVDRGARATGADRKPVGDAGCDIAGAHGGQLGVGAHVLAAAPRERSCGQDLIGEADDEDAQCGRQDVENRART